MRPAGSWGGGEQGFVLLIRNIGAQSGTAFQGSSQHVPVFDELCDFGLQFGNSPTMYSGFMGLF